MPVKGRDCMKDKRHMEERACVETERIVDIKRILQEEEEEERELYEYCLKLESMRQSCTEGDRNICGLIEEQMELLNALREEKCRFLGELPIHSERTAGERFDRRKKQI